jgi:hypothetical protein
MSRSWILRGLTLSVAVAVAGLPLAAQRNKRYEGIRWVRSYQEALAEGRDRGCPVLAVITNNQAHEDVTKIIHGDKNVIRATKYLVCVVAHNDYKSKEKPKKGQKREEMVADIYGDLKIKDLIKNYSTLNTRFVRYTVVQTVQFPIHIYVDPMNDEELFRRLGGLTRKEMLYDLKRAQKLVGKGISEKLAKYVRKKIDETRALISKGQFDRATELLTDFQSFEKKYAKRCKSVLIKEGRELIGELESKGSDLIRDARIQAENGNFDKAEHLLERVYREFRPFDISDKARKVLIEVKKQKARGS